MIIFSIKLDIYIMYGMSDDVSIMERVGRGDKTGVEGWNFKIDGNRAH